MSRLLDSLLVQDWPRDRYEIIVVHNFTPDGTEDAVRSRQREGEVQVRYFRTAFGGPGPSRQFGADQARGDVLAFIDDDCVATPAWIGAGVAEIATGFALVQGRTMQHPGQPRRLVEKTVTVEGPTLFFETCNIFYDAAAFRAVGGFPHHLSFVALGRGHVAGVGHAGRPAIEPASVHLRWCSTRFLGFPSGAGCARSLLSRPCR